MRNDFFLPLGMSILCLVAAPLVGCGGNVSTSGSSDSASGSSGSGGSSGSSGSSSGGDGSLCVPAVSGKAAPVEIELENTGATDLGYLTYCGDAWHIDTPDGSYAPKGVFSLLCEQPAVSCPLDCDDGSTTPVPAGTTAKFTWDGVLYTPVDAKANGCPGMNAGGGCPTMCSRRVDAPPGMYTVKAYLYPPGQPAITKMMTINYPSETKVHLTFP